MSGQPYHPGKLEGTSHDKNNDEHYNDHYNELNCGFIELSIPHYGQPELLTTDNFLESHSLFHHDDWKASCSLSSTATPNSCQIQMQYEYSNIELIKCLAQSTARIEKSTNNNPPYSVQEFVFAEALIYCGSSHRHIRVKPTLLQEFLKLIQNTAIASHSQSD